MEVQGCEWQELLGVIVYDEWIQKYKGFGIFILGKKKLRKRLIIEIFFDGDLGICECRCICEIFERIVVWFLKEKFKVV